MNLKEAIENVYYAKEMLEHAKEEIRLLVESGYEVTQEEFDDYYWNTDLNVSSVNPKKTLKPSVKTLECVCNLCKKEYIGVAKSRQQYNELKTDMKRKGKAGNCPNCINGRKESIKQYFIIEKLNQEDKCKNADIEKLKYMPYKEYLKTDHWNNTRYKALRKANFRCELCNDRGKLNVHHKTYENKGNEKPQDLICLCEKCHSKFHDKVEN